MEESLSLSSAFYEDRVAMNSDQPRLCTSNVEGPVICCSGSGSICAKYKLMSLVKPTVARSPCIAIPPGLGPTSFLEFPVFLSSLKAEPSSDAGSFSEPQVMHDSCKTAALSLNTLSSRKDALDERDTNCFEFKPQTDYHSVSALSSAGHEISTGVNQLPSEPFEQVQAQFPSQSCATFPSLKNEMAASSEELNLSAPPCQMFTSRSTVSAAVETDELNQGGPSAITIQPSQYECKETGAERSTGDGYNWRKYGQKLVKGCEFPRSYYRCTHPKCEVKKFFERAHDGKIVEIVYKGMHDHPKPQPNRRFPVGAVMSIADKISSLAGEEDKYILNPARAYNVGSNDAPKLSPLKANDDRAEAAVVQTNTTGEDVGEDDPFSKRRKIECGVDVVPVVKPIREQRVVVQTLSEIDILDDGYRWRKYGQKVVRGNPNPRSYYKCTNAGCPVRKHVERASHDHKAVITTYEGKHNHDVPTARISNQNTGASMVMNGMSRIRSEENDSICLDLGVGVGFGVEKQTLDAEPLQNRARSNNSDPKAVEAAPYSTYYAAVNGGTSMYGSIENRIESHSFETTPLDYSANPHPQNLGRILLSR